MPLTSEELAEYDRRIDAIGMQAQMYAEAAYLEYRPAGCGHDAEDMPF